MINNIYQKNNIVYSAEINGRTIVLNMETGRFYNLDDVGFLIWQLLDNPSTLNDIISGVAKECEIPASECQDDVADFVQTLLTNNLITVTEV